MQTHLLVLYRLNIRHRALLVYLLQLLLMNLKVPSDLTRKALPLLLLQHAEVFLDVVASLHL